MTSGPLMLELEKHVTDLEPRIIETRRKIHENPELSYSERATSSLVSERLLNLGVEVSTDVGGTTGVLGILRGTLDGKVVGLRADMDALPVNEEVDVSFKSRNAGVMHACGHDTHVAMLLGAAEILAQNRDQLHGTIKFFFQPAEEHGGRGGAKPMIEAGVMDNPKVDYVFGLHISSDFPSRTFGIRPGPFMASPTGFRIKVLGRSGHGASPHETVDPIFISAQLIVALQGVSSRMINPVEPFVLSVCSVHSGTKDNVIPDEAILEGTIRTMNDDTKSKATNYLSRITESICQGFDARYEVDFMQDTYPVTINDTKVTERVARILSSINGTMTKEIGVRLGAEDFSRFLQKASGTFYYLGTRNEEKGCTFPNHSSKFKVDEDVLKYGTISLVRLAMEFGS